MSAVAVHLVTDVGYTFSYDVDVTALVPWLEAAQAVCPDMGVVIMSLEESARTLNEGIERNTKIRLLAA